MHKICILVNCFDLIQGIVCFFSRFLGNHDRQNYFTNNQRSRVIWEILNATVYGKKKKAEIGIARLLEEEIFIGAYPLHDVNVL